MTDKIRLPGAKFVLNDCSGRPIACCETNEAGEAVFDCLPYGVYYLCEEEAPCGYEKICEPVKVVVCDNSCHRCVEVVNRKKMGSIKVIKFGEC